MLKKKRNKSIPNEKVEFSIDVKKEKHPLGYEDKQYFWVIYRNFDGYSCVYTTGWANSSEEAWKDANETYKRLVQKKQ